MARSIAKRITMKDIAIRTGFTVNTVSRALKNKDDISLETRKLIRQVADEMGYVGDSLAGSLRSGLTKTIAVIVTNIFNPHFAILVNEIERTIRKFGYTTIIINSEENISLEKQAILSSLSKKVDGIILCPVQDSEENITFLQKSGVPFVLIGRRFDKMDVDYVICDDEKGGYLATKHLLDRGHKEILFINGDNRISSAKERHIGYLKALQEYNIDYNADLVKEVKTNQKTEKCRHIVRKEIERGLNFTGIFAFNDVMAWEAIYVLQRYCINVPEQVGIVGFDNIQSRLFAPFPLTTISNSKSKMSRKAVEILLKKIADPDLEKIFQEIIDTTIIVRESS